MFRTPIVLLDGMLQIPSDVQIVGVENTMRSLNYPDLVKVVKQDDTHSVVRKRVNRAKKEPIQESKPLHARFVLKVNTEMR